MMIVMTPTATAEEITAVVERVNGARARAHVSPGSVRLDQVGQFVACASSPTSSLR